MFLVDSHCHLDSLDYETVHKDVAEVIQKAHELGVTHMLSVGVELSEFKALYELIKPFKEVWCAAGIHPENITLENKDWSEDELLDYLSWDKVIALGETGLDYVNSPHTKDIQIPSFAKQVAIAKHANKPLIIHGRGAMKDCIDIIKSEGNGDSCGVMHCYCDDIENARKSLDLGFYISFSGIVSFKKALNVQEACRYVPLDRMLIETDSPYLAPVPMRGKPNQPAFVSYTAEAVANIKGVSKEEVCDITSRNFSDCFKVNLD